MALKLHHEVGSAPTEPQPNTRYGAKVQSMSIEKGKVVITWSIYTRKLRKPNNGKEHDAKS